MKQYLISPEQILVLKQVSGYACKMFIELPDDNRKMSKPALVEWECLDRDLLTFRSQLELPLSSRYRLLFRIEMDGTFVAFHGSIQSRQTGQGDYTYGVKIGITDRARTLLYYTVNELLKRSDPVLSRKHSSYGSLYYCRPRINFLT